MQDKGKDKMDIEPTEEVTRGRLLLEKYLNFVDFLTMECFPGANLEAVFSSEEYKATEESLLMHVQESLIPLWPSVRLHPDAVRMILDKIKESAMINPGLEKYEVAWRKIDFNNLTDAQVDKIYRYACLFREIVLVEAS